MSFTPRHLRLVATLIAGLMAVAAGCSEADPIEVGEAAQTTVETTGDRSPAGASDEPAIAVQTTINVGDVPEPPDSLPPQPNTTPPSTFPSPPPPPTAPQYDWTGVELPAYGSFSLEPPRPPRDPNVAPTTIVEPEPEPLTTITSFSTLPDDLARMTGVWTLNTENPLFGGPEFRGVRQLQITQHPEMINAENSQTLVPEAFILHMQDGSCDGSALVQISLTNNRIQAIGSVAQTLVGRTSQCPILPLAMEPIFECLVADGCTYEEGFDLLTVEGSDGTPFEFIHTSSLNSRR